MKRKRTNNNPIRFFKNKDGIVTVEFGNTDVGTVYRGDPSGAPHSRPAPGWSAKRPGGLIRNFFKSRREAAEWLVLFHTTARAATKNETA